VGGVTIMAPPTRELRSLFHGLPFGEEVADLVEECYRPGGSLGGAFSELLRRILAAYDLVQVDPMLPALRALAAPALRAALEGAADLTAALLGRNAELRAAGYHAQVHVEEHTSLVFLIEEGRREALRRHGGHYVLNGRRFEARELAGRAESLSPNALLRPVVQDFLLPTVAYVGGPAEMAYLAQSQVLYNAILGRMPVAVPRAGFTLLDTRSDRLMRRYSLSLPDFYHGEEALRERIAAALVPAAVGAGVEHLSATVDAELTGLREQLLGFDASLAKAADRGASKIRYQISKLGRKVGRETLRRDERAAGDAASLYGLIYPERHLQERLYSILPFLAKHGLDLVARVYDNVRLDSPDHQVLVV
jgi:bacillithiol biosynthesis cysteine-adding enzyme BshC